MFLLYGRRIATHSVDPSLTHFLGEFPGLGLALVPNVVVPEADFYIHSYINAYMYNVHSYSIDCSIILVLFCHFTCFLLLSVPALLKHDEVKAKQPGVSDSGIEDPSSYQEPVQIHVGDSEFNSVGNWSSTIEGSVADTDYVDRLTQRQSSSDRKSNSRSTPISSITSEESHNESQKKHDRKSRNHPKPSDPVSPDQHKHEVQSVPQYTDNVYSPNPDSAIQLIPDSVPSQRPPGTKKKSSKKRLQDSGCEEVLISGEVSGYTDSHQNSAEQSKSLNNGIQADDEITRRHSKPRATSGARISGKTTGV